MALAFSLLPNLTSVVFTGPAFAMVQSLSPVRMRAMASAIVLLLANLIGMGLGPLSIGIASDALEPQYGDDALRYAYVFLMLGMGGWSALHFALAGRTLREDLEPEPADAA